MKILLTLIIPILAATMAPTAFADVQRGSGKCPTNYTPYTHKNGDAMCRSPEKKAPEKKEKSSSSSSSSDSGSRPGYTPPTFGEIAKANLLGFCPTGFYSNADNDRCVTGMTDAPKVTLKKGACPTGTIEEHGNFCTPTITDTSDDMIARLIGGAISDFNVVYLQLQIARKPLPANQVNPPALAAAIAKREAEGNPYKSARERDAEKNAPAQAAAKKASDDEAAALAKSREDAMRSGCRQQAAAGMPIQPQCVEFVGNGPKATASGPAGSDPQAAAASPVAAKVKEETAKALGGALKGLFGK